MAGFAGDLSEVRVWDYVVSQSVLNSRKAQSLAGNEDGLVGYWRLDQDNNNPP
ncbi:MAG: hypothetical protein WDM76_10345 [Limisphaerales bacterium]